jgi:TolB-like protein
MAPEPENNLRLEIGHVLFIDLVGYSKLLIEEQNERLRQLTDIVLATAQVREATNEKLIRLPTGDGMALVFRNSSEEPARCALEIAQALKAHPEIPVRMGIHSGPVSEVSDVNGRPNIAGAGINMAQRVMDCGDAGHILLSQRVADDLAQYRQWSPRLHDLGECEVKHGIKLHVANLLGEGFGNAAMPAKFAGTISGRKAAGPSRKVPIALAVAAVLLLAAGIIFFRLKSRANLPEIGSAKVPAKSIAVLPFENLSEEKENAYFASGIRDEILTKLAQLGELKVVSRTSSDKFQSRPDDVGGAARQLSVAYVLEGSVQKAGEQLLINVQLIDARADTHLWAQSYKRNFQNIFDVEAEVATQVAEALNIELAPAEAQRLEKVATQNSHAHDLYLRARALNARTDEQSLLQSVALLDQSVAEDPHYAPAWAELANVYLTLADAYRAPIDVLARMRDAALSAVQNDDKSAAGHVWLGALSMLFDRNYSLAKREIQRAVSLEPNSCAAHRWLGWYLGRVERDYRGSRAELRKAEALDPLHPWARWFESNVAIAQGDFDGALQLARRVIEIDPHFFYDEDPIAHAYIAMGKWEDAIRRYQSLPPSTFAIPNFELAVCYAHLGRTDMARQILVELEALESKAYVDKFHIAAIYAALGDKDKAFAALDRSIEDRSSRASTPRFYLWLKPLFDDPRFGAAQDKVTHSAILLGEQKR